MLADLEWREDPERGRIPMAGPAIEKIDAENWMEPLHAAEAPRSGVSVTHRLGAAPSVQRPSVSGRLKA